MYLYILYHILFIITIKCSFFKQNPATSNQLLDFLYSVLVEDPEDCPNQSYLHIFPEYPPTNPLIFANRCPFCTFLFKNAVNSAKEHKKRPIQNNNLKKWHKNSPLLKCRIFSYSFQIGALYRSTVCLFYLILCSKLTRIYYKSQQEYWF